jgi:pimeloyl-[acyl-carrier protein] methyl ester esterase
LSAGLRLLQDSDLRTELPDMKMPLRWLFGGGDTLVPAIVGKQVQGRHAIINGAGHAPFLSHPSATTAKIIDWLTETDGVNRYAAG